MIVAVDFDGTLTRTDDYPRAQPNHIGFHVIRKFQERGGKVILWTCLEYAVAFCGAFGLTFDAVNRNLPEMEQKWLQSCHTVSPKVFADVYVDDRGNTGVDWEAIDKLLNGGAK